jgi:hypothetical protein
MGLSTTFNSSIGPFLQGLKKTARNLNRNDRSPGRSSNLEPQKFEAELLDTDPRLSIILVPIASFISTKYT